MNALLEEETAGGDAAASAEAEVAALLGSADGDGDGDGGDGDGDGDAEGFADAEAEVEKQLLQVATACLVRVCLHVLSEFLVRLLLLAQFLVAVVLGSVRALALLVDCRRLSSLWLPETWSSAASTCPPPLRRS